MAQFQNGWKLNSRNWMLRILSHLAFLAWKSEPSQQKTRDWDFKPFSIWAISISDATDITWDTGGIVRWLKKSSKDFNDTWQQMYLKSRWLKIRTIHLSLFSRNISRVFLPKLLTFFSSEKMRWPKIRIILTRIQFHISARNNNHVSKSWESSLF